MNRYPTSYGLASDSSQSLLESGKGRAEGREVRRPNSHSWLRRWAWYMLRLKANTPNSVRKYRRSCVIWSFTYSYFRGVSVCFACNTAWVELFHLTKMKTSMIRYRMRLSCIRRILGMKYPTKVSCYCINSTSHSHGLPRPVPCRVGNACSLVMGTVLVETNWLFSPTLIDRS